LALLTEAGEVLEGAGLLAGDRNAGSPHAHFPFPAGLIPLSAAGPRGAVWGANPVQADLPGPAIAIGIKGIAGGAVPALSIHAFKALPAGGGDTGDGDRLRGGVRDDQLPRTPERSDEHKAE